MTTLNVRIGDLKDSLRRAGAAMRALEAGRSVDSDMSVTFPSYDAMHRVLSPARLAIVQTMAGQGVMSMREVARRVGRDFKGVHTDVAALIDAGVIERQADGIVFPHDRIRVEFVIDAAA